MPDWQPALLDESVAVEVYFFDRASVPAGINLTVNTDTGRVDVQTSQGWIENAPEGLTMVRPSSDTPQELIDESGLDEERNPTIIDPNRLTVEE